MTVATRSLASLGDEFLESVRNRDWSRLAATFTVDARFRAAVPNEERPFRDKTGGSEVADQMSRWFDGDVHEVVAGAVNELSDRVHIWYRVRGHDADGWYLVEQHAFGEMSTDREGFHRMNLTCSGFRPAAPPTGLREEDAG